jgi:hypothetical protein
VTRDALQETHLDRAPYIFFRFASPYALGSGSRDLINVLFEREGFNVLEDLVAVLRAYRLTHAFDEGRVALQRRIELGQFWGEKYAFKVVGQQVRRWVMQGQGDLPC